MPSFKTAYSGYSVEFSPFEEDKLAVSTAQHFGIIGSGRQYILQVQNDESEATTTGAGGNAITKVHSYDTTDGLYDCCWSEENENVLISASGDGSIKMFDVSQQEEATATMASLEEHTKEVYSVDFNLVGKDTFVTGSWDNSIKLWNVSETTSLETYDEHKYCVYSTIWNPTSNDLFASASGDQTLKVWDINDIHSVQTIKAHGFEILTCDWNKYNDNILVSGSVDKTIKIWDLRNPEQELNTLKGHTYGIRRLKCSPHDENIIASCSYDMTLMVWDSEKEDALIEKYEHHTEFVVGVDFNLENEEEIASCSWDETVFVWNRGEEPIPTHDEDDEGEENEDEIDKQLRAQFAQGYGSGGMTGGRRYEDVDEDEPL